MKSDQIGSSIDKITIEAVENSATSIIPAGSILIVVRSGILARTIPTALTTCDLTVNQDIKALCPSKRVHNRYLHYFMQSAEREILKLVTRGATVHRLSTDSLKAFPIPVPHLPEQRRIVAILDEAFEGISAAVANAEKNLANARELFDSYLNSVFTRKGEGWVENKLGDLIDIVHGYAFDGSDFATSDDKDKPIVLTPGNYTENAELNFTPKNTKRFTGNPPAAFLFNPGDLTVVMTDLSSKMKILGKPAFVEQPNVLHNQRIGRILMKTTSISPRYIFYFLRTRQVSENIKETATGTMVRHTAPKRILSIVIPFPPDLFDQQDIISRLAALSEETKRLEAIYQQKLDILSELKQAILQKAFAGELTAQPEQFLREAVA